MNSVRDPTKTTDWGTFGACGFCYWDNTTTGAQACFLIENIGTGLNALYFITNKREQTGQKNSCGSGGTHTNLLSFTGQHRNVPNNIDIYNNIDNYIGYIVYSTGNYKTYNYDE